MVTLLAFPLFLLAMMLQTAIISRVTLLNGCADLILVILAGWALQERVKTAWQWALVGGALFSFISRVPWFVPLVGYLATVALARLFQRHFWQAPLLAMFAVCFFGTLAMHFLSFFSLRLIGNPLPIAASFNLIILPSVLLNLLLAIPIFFGMRDLANWLYPKVVEA